MLKVWGRKSSSNVQALLWCLAELELDYQRVDAGFTYGVVNTPEYLEMNPNATVPTLVDGEDPPIYETGAIIRYLATRYATDAFWPADLVARTHVDKWAEWSKINVAQAFTSPIFWQVVRTAPSKRNDAAVAEALIKLNAKLKIADRQLANHQYLTSDNLTLADIQLGHVLYRYFDIDIKREPFEHLQRYYEQLQTLESYRETVMYSYEELRVSD